MMSYRTKEIIKDIAEYTAAIVFGLPIAGIVAYTLWYTLLHTLLEIV